jgi:hypothetical protein
MSPLMPLLGWLVHPISRAAAQNYMPLGIVDQSPLVGNGRRRSANILNQRKQKKYKSKHACQVMH